MSNELIVKTFQGPQVRDYIPDLARLRMTVFREYPYLYEGSQEYERRYLQTYAQSPESLFVLVFREEEVVGASTAMPMRDEEAAFRQPFIDQGYDPEKIFYFGESVLLRAFRGRGLGKRFFEERENHARAPGRFEYCCFCAVERDPADPRRPADYRPLDEFWKKRGYQKHPGLRASYSWREVGREEETAKPMVFWLKPLL